MRYGISSYYPMRLSAQKTGGLFWYRHGKKILCDTDIVMCVVRCTDSTRNVPSIAGRDGFCCAQSGVFILGENWSICQSLTEGKGQNLVSFRCEYLYCSSEHQAYQRQQCRFDNIGQTMQLVANYVSPNRLFCEDVELPDVPWAHCDNAILLEQDIRLHYFSGIIEANHKFHYGYFEIRCKLPIHQGAFPALWLWDASEALHFYEEIDIFEFSWHLKKTGSGLAWACTSPVSPLATAGPSPKRW